MMQTLTVGQLYDRAVQQGGDDIAISHDTKHLSYRELGEQAARLTGGLSALGVGRADRVAFLMVNCPEYVACEYALAHLGATRVPLAVLLGNDDHIYMMNFARCKVLVYPEAGRARAANTCVSGNGGAIHLRC